jgi:hypothetical protein
MILHVKQGYKDGLIFDNFLQKFSYEFGVALDISKISSIHSCQS